MILEVIELTGPSRESLRGLMERLLRWIKYDFEIDPENPEKGIVIKLVMNHPLLSSVIDIGNRTREIRSYVEKQYPQLINLGEYLGGDELDRLKKLHGKGKKGMSKGEREEYDSLIKMVRERFLMELEGVRGDINNFLVNRLLSVLYEDLNEKRVVIVGDFSGVSYPEWPNSFYGLGDKMDVSDLEAGLNVLLESVPISSRLAVWFDDPDVNHRLATRFRLSDFRDIKRKHLRVGRVDDSFAYIVFLGLLVYLAMKESEFEDVLSELPNVPFGYIFVNVGRGDRRVYIIPRLDRFYHRWIAREENRRSLRSFLDLVNRVAGIFNEKKLESKSSAFLSLVDSICYQLIKVGYPDPSLFRRALDYILDLFLDISSNPSDRNYSKILKPLEPLSVFASEWR